MAIPNGARPRCSLGQCTYTSAQARHGQGSPVGQSPAKTRLLPTLHTASSAFTKSTEAAITILLLQMRSRRSEKVNDLPKLAELERGSGRIQTEDFRLQSSLSLIIVATRHHHLFIIINKYLSRKGPPPTWHCSCFHSNTLLESHGSILCLKEQCCNAL